MLSSPTRLCQHPLPATSAHLRPSRRTIFRGSKRCINRRSQPRSHLARLSGSIEAVMSGSTVPGSPKIPPPEVIACLPDLSPCTGQLVHLPTRAEVQSVLALADGFVVEVPVRAANDVLTAIDQVVEKDKSVTLSHLRRIAKSNNLPKYVQDRLRIIKDTAQDNQEASLKVLDVNREVQSPDSCTGSRALQDSESIFLLLGLTRLVSLESITKVLQKYDVRSTVFRTRVPISPPMNTTLAREWSELYWPTLYRKSTPLGPHPALVRQGTESTSPYSGFWMALVAKVAQEGSKSGFGLPIGALIVDSKSSLTPMPVVVAADARHGIGGSNCRMNENIMNHAVMRAIGLVGRMRISLADPSRTATTNDIVLDYPLLEMEQKVFDMKKLQPGGYLCTGLDIYLTHEPCVMCAQAILHSRFDKVIFRRRMSKTGAATPERPGTQHAGLGYGLFWRPELNWRLLVWEWKDAEPLPADNVPAYVHA